MSRPVVVVAGRHRPHEMFLLAVSVLIGAAYLLGSPPPGSLAALLHHHYVHIWAVAMLVSGVAGLAGCLWRGVRGMEIERGALLLQAGAVVLYTAALFEAAGWRALTAGLIAGAWAAANVVRAAQVSRELRDTTG